MRNPAQLWRDLGARRFWGVQILFAGTLSLENNGGFSSVRTDDGPWDLSGTEGISLRVRGDGRTYQLRLSTDAEYRGDRIAYQAPFKTIKGKWAEVSVPFVNLTPSHHGEQLDGPEFNLSNVTEVGIILADKKAGDFALEVDWMKTYEAESGE
jgi:monofunctional biosynthetic peptidoglycan transglycosylase